MNGPIITKKFFPFHNPFYISSMKLVLAAALPLTALPLIVQTLQKVNAFQTQFAPGGPFAQTAQLVNQLTGADAAEKSRLASTVNEVRTSLQNNYFSASGGGNLFEPFTPAKSDWLQTAINSNIAGAVAKTENARRSGNAGELRVMARYVKAFDLLTAENKQRLEDARRQINAGPGGATDNATKIAGAAAVGGLLLKIAGVI